MRLSMLALVGAIAGCLSAPAAYAQIAPGQSAPVQPTAYEYNSYYAQQDDEMAGAKERGVEGEPDPQAAQAPAEEEEESFGNGCGTLLNPYCCLGDQWKIFDSECLECRGINVTGWLAMNPFTWNTTNPADRFNGPVTFTDRSNDFQLNQLYLFAEKATDTGGCGWDWGYRADFMGGTDYRFTTAAGLETHGYYQFPKVSTQRFYGYAFPQFYLEAAYNDLKVKVGHFYAPVGYEVVTATGNFFPNLPYTFQYGEPFTFTGVLATYTAGENLTLIGGVTHGWDNFDNSANPHAGGIVGFTETFEDGAAFAATFTFGVEPNSFNALLQGVTFSERYLQTLVYSRPLASISDRLTYVAQSDFGYQNDVFGAGTTDAYWYGLNQYLFYKVSDCMSYGIRAEWFRDEDGARVGGFLGTTPDGSTRGLSTSRFGYPGSFYEVTLGANYKYSANTTFRPYVRFDWFSGTSPAANLRPFDGGNGNSQTLLGFDVIMLY
ncbi:MAG: outer membrane beta-barrel protein [Pirellulales bacterium]